MTIKITKKYTPVYYSAGSKWKGNQYTEKEHAELEIYENATRASWGKDKYEEFNYAKIEEVYVPEEIVEGEE